MELLKIVSCNVRGIAQASKRRQFFKQFHENEYDVVFLQETHSKRNTEHYWRAEWGGKVVFSHGESNARGVAILFAKNLEITKCKSERSEDGRYLIVQVTINGFEFLLCNVYAPNEDQPDFFANIFHKIESFSGDHPILGEI